ncbi:hypothetical protein [Corynebacterium aquilae]|uniref:Bacterial EndoU nuclease domain-containing protein n=1 Tax=Corynebacterium aquilae DSM 44791 TaxID=1431546 RepID=A0A1L7CFA1_9CORY|nr:hypothetical protein [Corynebacterium aquilae]APT84504.1 hypothetical protein CAQU_04885 [Corynebacterium aquilae DSM 44791]
MSLELAVAQAQQRLQQEWVAIVARYETAEQRQEALRAVYEDIVETQGLAVAVDAANMVELSRLSHPELRHLPTPEVARTAKRTAVVATLDEAFDMWQDVDELPGSLSRMLTTLVLQPARNTVMMATAHARTGYVLVPNATACAWCLMRASGGTKQRSVGDGGDFHPGCQCWVAEAMAGVVESVPEITREVIAMARRSGLTDSEEDQRAWEIARRDSLLRLSDFRAFPPIPGVEIPEVRLRHFVSTTGVELPQPRIENVFGHVLYGWRGNTSILEMLKYARWGHTADTLAPQEDKTRFPEYWEDQDIVDALVVGLEDSGPWEVWQARTNGAHARTRVHKVFEYAGLKVKLQYYIGRDGGGEHLTAFPVE